MSAFLAREDVARICSMRLRSRPTARTFAAQRRVLAQLGYIERRHYIVAANGEPLVRRDMTDIELRPKAAAINWDALKKRQRVQA